MGTGQLHKEYIQISVFTNYQRNLVCDLPFLTRECAHAHERVIAIVGFSLGRSVWLLTFEHAL